MATGWNWDVYLEETPETGARYIDWLLSGLGWTIATALSAWVIAVILGTIVGVMRTTPNKWAVRLGNFYVELFRNIPLIVQMFLWFFVIPDWFPDGIAKWIKSIDPPWSMFSTAVIALGLFTSARIAEQVRSGIQSIPRGQTLAATALGLTTAQMYRYVLLPVAARIIIPPFTSEFMNIFKNSSVALAIGLLELTAQARQMNEFTFKTFEAFGAATVMYIVVAFSVNRLMAYVERKAQVPGLGAKGKT
jgi:glutamate/aspartate transport system permease protein